MSIKKKVCMLGAFAVGKTSLVQRFIKSVFGEKYQTTVGVKTDKKDVEVDGRAVTLMLWDMAGKDDFSSINPAHLRGMAGAMIVADGTRAKTLETARGVRDLVVEKVGEVPFLLLVNKCDLKAEWEVEESALQELRDMGWTVLETSAKSGQSVEEAFLELARRTVA